MRRVRFLIVGIRVGDLTEETNTFALKFIACKTEILLEDKERMGSINP